MTTPIPPNPPRWTPAADPTSIVVPGLDTNASVNDQIDQIEQLITLKLQNIDANFSKIQNVVATRLLPAVKRHAVSTEPVRDAARFWTSFYEKAAQVHIPTFEDYYGDDTQSQTSLPAEGTPEVIPSDGGTTPSHGAQTEASVYHVSASENSFMPTNAVSSTPARAGHLHDQTASDQPSWSASLESPLVRLDRELQTFSLEEQEAPSARHNAQDSFTCEDEDTIQRDIDIKGKHKLPTPRARPSGAHVSPVKVKSKTPIAIPKHIQPYLPPKSQPEPALPSPRRPKYQRSPHKLQPERWASTSTSSSALDIPSLTKHLSQTNADKQFDEFNDSFDDSVEIMRGMSPPKTMAFARAPRSSIGLGLLLPPGRTPGKNHLPALSKTPMKEAADRIRRDLVGDALNQNASHGGAATRGPSQIHEYGIAPVKDDTMSTIPTPPSLSRYTRRPYPSDTDNDETDEGLEAVLRRVGLKLPESSSRTSSVASDAKVFSHRNSATETLAPSVSRHKIYTSDQQSQDVLHLHQDEQSVIGMVDGKQRPGDSDSDSDSLGDEPPQPGHPSTAFLMASARDPDPDDSFASSSSNRSSDSLGEEYGSDEVVGAPVHPFARAMDAGEGDGFDDSFDSVEGDGELAGEVVETVFGIHPAQRRQGARVHGELRMMGEDLLQDTVGIGRRLATAGMVEESPTPLGRI